MSTINFVFLLLVIGCSSNKGKFNNSDFAGKTFDMKQSMDVLLSDLVKNGDIKVTMIFGEDSSLVMRTSSGPQFKDSPYFWRVENDSMEIWNKDNSSRSKLVISKKTKGFQMEDSTQVVLLTEIE